MQRTEPLNGTKSQEKMPDPSIGPYPKNDLRWLRPYFLVPLLRSGEAAPHQEVADEIRRQSASSGDPVTDLFILSHGWHRNFCSAVSAYDRVISRLSLLLQTGRLTPADSDRRQSPDAGQFRPVFVNLHWHSDPGDDLWEDLSGRRHKADFLRNVDDAFLPGCNHAVYVRDFEAIFEYFSSISAADNPDLPFQDVDERGNTLTTALNTYAVKDAPTATLADKAALVWRCYFEATPKQVLRDQDPPGLGGPGQFQHLRQAVSTAAKFLTATLGLIILLGLLLKAPWAKLWQDFFHLPLIRPAVDIVQSAWTLAAHALSWPGRLDGGVILSVLLAALLFLLCVFYLKAKALPKTTSGQTPLQTRPAGSLPVLRLLAWVYLQILCGIPLVLYCLVTYVLGALLGRRTPWLFDERNGQRGQAPPATVPTAYPGSILINIALFPVQLIGKALPKDSGAVGLIDTLSSQLAFWDMQRRGVAAGQQAADFVQRLLAETEELRGARIHFLGHSFGAVVVCNAVRHLAYDPVFTRRIDTLCLLEAAFASDWFRGETAIQDKVDSLASIFSRYDTATGFYYPVANHARLCAGQIGVCADGPRFQPEPKGRYALLVRPPDLGPTNFRPRVLNIDASRLLYEGPPASGGGHDDIFKDDVLYLLWAVSRLPKEDNPLGDAETVPLGQASPARP